MTELSDAPPLGGPGLSPRLAEVLQDHAGARYLCADLQVHTPVDARFEPGPEPKDPEARAELAREYLANAKERGIDLVGITEHNDVSWIDELRHAARQVCMNLLPGFEVESAEGVHVLCLFDPQTPVSHLEECLARLGLTQDKRARRSPLLPADRHFRELVRFIQGECGGICVAAHIESGKGLLAALHETARVNAWKTPELLAAQISRPPNEVESGNGRIVRGEDPIYKRERLPAYILTSDSRSLTEIGGKSTWVKMDEIGVEGLRQAFLDPESRIAYADPAERRQGTRLVAAVWEGGFLDGVGFAINPELNCLIGGKGTGKSTVIETIRFAFGCDYRTEEVGLAATHLLEHAFRSGSKVSVIVETDAPARKRYVIERTAPHAPVVRDIDGRAMPELSPLGLLCPSVYGQKEIYGVAQDPPALLTLLDGFAQEELRPALDVEQTRLERTRQNGRLIVDAQRRIDDAEGKLAELPALEEWRARFKEAGFEELLRERRLLDREERLLEHAAQGLDRRLRALDDVEADDDRLARALEFMPGEEDLPNADLLRQGYQLLEQADARWAAAVHDLRSELVEAQRQLDEVVASWKTRRQARAAEFDRALRELQSRMPDVDPERYLDVERRIEQLMPLRDVLVQLRDRLRKAREERERLLVDLNDARGDKHRIRSRAAQRLNEALDGNLLVEVTYQGDRGAFVDRLVELRSGARVEALKRMVNNPSFIPAEFAAHVRRRALGGKYDLPAGQASQLERALGEETLLDLELAELPDRVELKLDTGLGGKPDYRALDRLSPGQRSTAILMLIMQESRDPLLIDQPEDDLDNRFIYDDVVRRLRRAKVARQFLIATHNANIPVLGDAEQIVALDAKEQHGPVTSYVRARGSIDTHDVREAAEQILEGGREAFALRQAKYGI